MNNAVSPASPSSSARKTFLMIFSFQPWPVTVLTTVTYAVLFLAQLLVHVIVPAQPDLDAVGAAESTNLTEARIDLSSLTRHYHPYNSRFNDHVREWILQRVRQILAENQVSFATDYSGGVVRSDAFHSSPESLPLDPAQVPIRDRDAAASAVVIFDDRVSNVTSVQKSIAGTSGTYFEGNNVAVYVRGTEDPAGDWWARPAKSYGKGGVLVNAHFDSASTGFGATDDGVGVVCLLQLLRHSTHPKRARLEKGIVILFNNNEEDMLWGARAFGYSPLLPFVTTFVNLEGAGAGGRAVLFRTTDQQVTEAYADSPHPFGSVIGSDAFKRGIVRGDTDYGVWDGAYGLRGVDIAFYQVRAFYHTRQDDARHTSTGSIAHMLTAAIATAENLASDTSDRFLGERPDGDREKAQNGKGTDGVWFDLFGKGFVLFGLRSVMFAGSLALLIAGPIILATVTYLLVRKNRYYFFARDVTLHEHAVDQPVSLGGWKGFFRLPFALVVTCSLLVGVAVTVSTVNPLIVYSSQYEVWAMMLSLSYSSLWACMRLANYARPSALHRGFVIVWLFGITWILLVVATVFEDRFAVASGYPVVFLHAAAFLASLITLCDFIALPGKRSFAEDTHEAHHYFNRAESGHSRDRQRPPHSPPPPQEQDSDSEADERTPLRSGEGDDGLRQVLRTMSFRNTMNASRRSMSTLLKSREQNRPHGREQTWSGAMPSATWLLQWLILGPVAIVLFSQAGLLTVTGVAQTGPEGGIPFLPYLLTAIMSIFLLLPLTPFVHRVTHHVPAALLVVFLGTLVYNLVAFPFSASSPCRVYFRQHVSLDRGSSTVVVTGLEDLVRSILADIPTAAGQDIRCAPSPRSGLASCRYDSSSMLPSLGAPGDPDRNLSSLVTFNYTRAGADANNRATLHVDAVNTRSCLLEFEQPIASFFVHDSAGRDRRFYVPSDEGINTLQLYRRDRSTPWAVDVHWSDDGKSPDDDDDDDAEEEGSHAKATPLRGTVKCQWDDANVAGAIPAFDEALHYVPDWALVTKFGPGLVYGEKEFGVQ